MSQAATVEPLSHSVLYPLALANASRKVRDRFEAVKADQRHEFALRQDRNTQANELRRAANEIRNRLAMNESQRKPDKKLDAELSAELRDLSSRISKLENATTRRTYVDECETAFMGFDGFLVEVEWPEWSPRKGEDLLQAYEREFNETKRLAAERSKVKNAKMPVAEMVADVEARLDAMAKAPELGGIHERFKESQIGWPQQNIYGVMDSINDAIPFLLWLMGDEIKAKFRKLIELDYDDPNAISTADYNSRLAKAEAALMKQRRVCESAYQYCVARGMNRLNRPPHTPACVILGVEPFERFADDD